jgi:molybdopterin-guanine dinucleotide biosynthesis protein A
MIENIPCVILSGGKSSRMGEDKSLLPFGNYDTMCEYQYNKLSKIFKKTYISSKIDKFDFLTKKEKKEILILDEEKNQFSPIIALQNIFKKLHYKKVFIISIDIPLVKKETILDLIKNSKKYDITIAKDDEFVHNLCGIFDKNLLNTIDTMISKDIHKVNYMIKENKKTKILAYNDKTQFLNLNEKSTYNEANSISNSYSKY